MFYRSTIEENNNYEMIHQFAVGKNERIIQEYIRNQLEEDNMHEQISMKEYMDPFTGSKNK